MKNYTNGQIVLTADAKVNDDAVHLLTADVGEMLEKLLSIRNDVIEN